jgi:ribosomal-protein-alanine N-acetyltransferase
VREADDAAAEAVGALHDAAFPTGYLTGADLAAKRDAHHRLFVAPDPAEPAGVAGYVLAERFVEDGEGYVHFLAVAPAARRRGVGGRLLAAALHWLFELEGARCVSLTVRGDLGGAQQLYERAGFARAHTGVALRRERP